MYSESASFFEREREMERNYVVNQVRGDGEILSQVVSSQVSIISSICISYISYSFDISIVLAEILRVHTHRIREGGIDGPIWRRVSKNGPTRAFRCHR